MSEIDTLAVGRPLEQLSDEYRVAENALRRIVAIMLLLLSVAFGFVHNKERWGLVHAPRNAPPAAMHSPDATPLDLNIPDDAFVGAQSFGVRTLPQLADAVRDLGTPSSGEQVLPPIVREMLALLRQYGVQEYTLSPEILKHDEVTQRIVESAFPKLRVLNAPYLLAFRDENLPPMCNAMKPDERYIQLADCR